MFAHPRSLTLIRTLSMKKIYTKAKRSLKQFNSLGDDGDDDVVQGVVVEQRNSGSSNKIRFIVSAPRLSVSR